MKNINRKGFSIIEIMIILLITASIMAFGFQSAFQFYKHISNRYQDDLIKEKIINFIDSSSVGRGISRIRIKENVLLFRNGFNYIDNYYYTEVYKEDPVTLERSAIPTPEFYGYERINFPKDISFVFSNDIEGTTLINDPLVNTTMLGIKRVIPKNDFKLFDASSSYFQIISPMNERLFRTDFTFGKGEKSLIKSSESLDDTHYYDIVKGASIPLFTVGTITVLKKGIEIGRIEIDTIKKKLVYIDKKRQH